MTKRKNRLIAAILCLVLVIGAMASCMKAPAQPNTAPGQTTEDTAPGEDDKKPGDSSVADDDFIKIYDENGNPKLPEGAEVGSMNAVSYYDFVDPQKWEKFNNYVFSDLSSFDEPKVTSTEGGSVTELPIFADFLQYTGYSAFLLSGNDGGLIGIQIEKEGIDAALITADTVNKDAEISLTGGQTVKVKAGTAASRCRVFSEWAEKEGKAFYPLAARVRSDGDVFLEIIGKLGENGRLVIAEKDRLDVSGIELEYVPAVYSLSEAAEAYKQYVEKRLRFAKEELFLVPWEGELIAGKSAYKKLTADVLDGSAESDCIYKLHPDEIIAIPMANYNPFSGISREGDRMLFISFKNGQAIGETVLEFYHPWATVGLSDPVYHNGVYAGLIYERLGTKADDGYKALGSIGYVSFVKSLGDLSGVAGIYADAGGYHAIMK